MLKSLRIKNFAIIEESELEFSDGLNIISGETGAGKSIIMDALHLLLGGRASSEIVRADTEEAIVEGLFLLSDQNQIQNLLEDIGIIVDDEELIIRRIIHRSGKNRIYLNDNMVTLSSLQEITKGLVDLCSQHDQRLLINPIEQANWIDKFGRYEKIKNEYIDSFREWKLLSKTVEDLESSIKDREQKLDFLKFQIQEIEEAQLAAKNEDSEIETEISLLENAEDLFLLVQDFESAIQGEDTSIIDQISKLTNRILGLKNSAPSFEPIVEQLKSAKILLEESLYSIRNMSGQINHEEGRLDQLNARIDQINKIKRKYGSTISDVLISLEKFKSEYAILSNHESSLEQANKQRDIALKAVTTKGQALTNKRQQSAKQMDLSISKELHELHMLGARFEVRFEKIEAPTLQGLETAKFYISANPGEPTQPIQKVASGGELSRVMLAIHSIVSSKGGVGVYLFDEVDSGIGGQTAKVVGQKLKSVAQNHQVICITHLPQVAAFADGHFHVEKEIRIIGGKKRTTSTVKQLSFNERAIELTKMMGGDTNNKSALATAKDLLSSIHSTEKKSGKKSNNAQRK
ncbi:MAG: DNA repair protein RecN [Oligoflexia bacterium]|nr:DNA repair protein RecN [Oligoflexia bacterium]